MEILFYNQLEQIQYQGSIPFS